MAEDIVLAFHVAYLNGCIQVIDMCPQAGGRASPIEDAPHLVIHELKKMGYEVDNRPILYLDINGKWDQMKVHNGEFDNYRMLNVDTWEQAVSILLRNRILDMPKQGDTLWDTSTQPWTGISGGGHILLNTATKH